MKRLFSLLMIAAASFPVLAEGALTAEQETAIRNIERAIALTDATWKGSIKGQTDNLYMADTYNVRTGATSGPSDVWPYTAAIEAHNSILEALEAAKDIAPDLYDKNYEKYKTNLDKLIDNLEWYRGSYVLPSYAVSKEVNPYAVPRAAQRNGADCTGILNVYDDQMWLSRELIRAYKLTGNEAYLKDATYLADYALEGWDCWRDASGEEYGGITWGPGYNSKHACSNGPIIQPLVWLSEIYTPTDETMEYYYRDRDNKVVQETVARGDHYLNFAKKVYDWQKKNLKHESGVYWDMMGADNTINVVDGYRQHMDCGGPTGALISYNTGTMISGGADLYKMTNDPVYLEDIEAATKASLNNFSKYDRKTGRYQFNTDNTAEQGFTTWFNDVLMRSYADAYPLVEGSASKNGLESFQGNLDYGYENNLKNGLLPIHLMEGWGDEKITKGFHQFSFASQYAVLANWLLEKAKASQAGAASPVAEKTNNKTVYTLSGVNKGEYANVKDSLPRDIYIVGGEKMICGK